VFRDTRCFVGKSILCERVFMSSVVVSLSFVSVGEKGCGSRSVCLEFNVCRSI